MSSDSLSTSTITIVPLGTTIFQGSLISHELTELIAHAKANDEKVLILYNRRGSGRAWICQDCGYFPTCPHCDIALAYHTSPKRQLICHQCSYTTSVAMSCIQCHGQRSHPVGIGIQRVEEDMRRIFSESEIFRIDSDANISKGDILGHIEHADIILGTQIHISLLHHRAISHIVFLLFESDLTLPDYRMEEDVYHLLDYAKKSSKHLFIQTYTDEHPLLSLIVSGNYRDFLTEMSRERERFHYPPYSEFAMIRVHDTSKEKVQDIIVKMLNKIDIVKSEEIFVAADRDIWERYAGEWIQKIILKGKDVRGLLSHLEVEIIRNRSVTLEWR